MDGDAVPVLRFALLGPIRVWAGETLLPAGSPQQRALLAALLLRGGRTATADELIDALWGEQPPDSALAALRTYAFRLRKTLGAETLTSVSGGYALRTAPDAVDLAVAERHAAEAERARAAGEPSRARELLASALRLWQGEPLAGLPGPHADTQRTRLSEWRLSLLESRLQLDLDLGGHTEVVSELTVLTAEHPLSERLRALLMLALYRGGRQAEALGVYADTRRLLTEELGVEPCAELSELHQRILRADPELTPPTPPPGESAAAEPRVRPAQLPAAVPDFTGRADQVTELVDALSGTGGGVMALSAMAGIGGVGKTALAVHVAHTAKDAFPDGQLYVDLQGQDTRAAEPDAVLASFLRALGVPAGSVPDRLEDRAALYRSLLSGRRVLALLDNARDAAQVRPLLPGTPGSAALITSRARMVDLEGARLLDVDVMRPQEALQLLIRIVGSERVLAERQVALELLAACGFLPLAIRIAASRLATRRSWTVSVLARKLSDERRRLDELTAGDLAVKATFELSYRHLTGEQARAFRLLALPDGPDLSLDAAAALLDLDPYDAERVLESLVDISLLESAAPARYRFHDLIRLYARTCAEREETPAEREAAAARLTDFYLATATRVYALENPGDRALDHLLPTAHPGLEFAGRDEGLDWLYAEAPGLLSAVRGRAADAAPGGLRAAVDLLWAGQDLMESGAHSRHYERCSQAIIAAADRRGDALVEGRARILLGRFLSWSTSRHVEADREAERSQLLGQAAQDPLTSSYAPNLRGLIAKDQGRFADATAFYRKAIDSFRADGNRHGVAAASANLSRIYTDLGEVGAAVRTAEESVAEYRALQSGFRLGGALYALAVALTAGERTDEALARLGEALPMFRESRQRVWEGVTLFRMAEAQLAAGRHRQAASHAEQALTLLNDAGGHWQKANVLAALGDALSRIGQPDRARACWHDALSMLPDPHGEAAQRLRGLLEPPSISIVAV